MLGGLELWGREKLSKLRTAVVKERLWTRTSVELSCGMERGEVQRGLCSWR